MLVSIVRLVKSFSMKANRRLFFTLSTFNIVWGKPRGGEAPTSWLVGPLATDLVPTGCTNCSPANSIIQTPTHTLCVLHPSTWLSAQPLTLARWVRCMCVVPRIVPNDDWTIPACSAQADWTKGGVLLQSSLALHIAFVCGGQGPSPSSHGIATRDKQLAWLLS